MGIEANDPTVTNAMALALVRQALKPLDTIDEGPPALHLKTAIDALLRKGSASSGHPAA